MMRCSQDAMTGHPDEGIPFDSCHGINNTEHLHWNPPRLSIVLTEPDI